MSLKESLPPDTIIFVKFQLPTIVYDGYWNKHTSLHSKFKNLVKQAIRPISPEEASPWIVVHFDCQVVRSISSPMRGNPKSKLIHLTCGIYSGIWNSISSYWLIYFYKCSENRVAKSTIASIATEPGSPAFKSSHCSHYSTPV